MQSFKKHYKENEREEVKWESKKHFEPEKSKEEVKSCEKKHLKPVQGSSENSSETTRLKVLDKIGLWHLDMNWDLGGV